MAAVYTPCTRHHPRLTCDVLAQLVVGLLQRLHQLRDASLLDQRHLVVHVLVDEVAGGAGGEALHLLVLAVEELHQLADALQAAHLRIGITDVLKLLDMQTSGHSRYCSKKNPHESKSHFLHRGDGNTK